MAGSSPNTSTPKPLPLVNSNWPEHFVYIEGVPQAKASIKGKFHPSDLAQDIKAYKRLQQIDLTSLPQKPYLEVNFVDGPYVCLRNAKNFNILILLSSKL